jgi:GNAT superfamily N-acetyltransferase
VNTELLAEHSESIPELADWYLSEWEPYYGADGPGDALADLRSRCNRAEIPIGFVAVEDGEIIGTAALDVDAATQRAPSVVGLLVRPSQRRRGVARVLLRGAEDLAKALGYSQVFISTIVLGDLLLRMGWHSQGQVEFVSGETGAVFVKNLET